MTEDRRIASSLAGRKVYIVKEFWNILEKKC